MADLAPQHPPLAPDAANERLTALVAAKTWAVEPREDPYDFVAIGAGTAGLVGTVGMAMLGARVALVERHLIGGDCLVTGCVPSKALLHAGQVAHDARNAAKIGVMTGEVRVDFAAVMNSLRQTRAQIAEDDSSHVKDHGIEVIAGQARFTGPRELEVDGKRVRFKRCLIATGGRPRVPDIPGLADIDPLTSETIFELQDHPGRLAVIGGGPIGCELSQAMQRLDVDTVLLQRGPRLLPGDDPEASQIVADTLRAEGVDVRLGADVVSATRDGDAIRLVVRTADGESTVECDRVLVATGRTPNIENLGLDAAGVEFGKRGINVNAQHRSTNRRVYAAGDVAASHQFTHAAWAQAEYAVLNAFFPVWLDIAGRTMPWATYTDPEVAHVGMSHRELEALGDEVDTLTVHTHENDRAQIEGERVGFARVHLRKGSDKILAATIVGRQAGELIVELGLAMTQGIGLSKLTSTIVPYPTRSELVRDLAYAYGTRRVSPLVKRLARWWFSLLR